MPRAGAAARDGLRLLELEDAGQHLPQPLFGVRRHGRCVQAVQRLFERLAARPSAEHLLPHRLHGVFGEQAADHPDFRRPRRIVEHTELRAVLRIGTEERTARTLAEPGGNDKRHARGAPAHALTRIGGGGHRDGEVLVRLHACDDRRRNRAGVLVRDRHGDASPRARARGALHQRPQERGNHDRHGERDKQRSPIREEQLQVLADDGPERSEHGQSLRLFPVSDRNTDSSDPRAAPAGAGTRACKPSSVSLAMTLPRSMTTRRSARRSASSI